MHNFFEVVFNYEKTLENGQEKKVNELYLVDALSFTEAEARAIENVKPYISGEFLIKSIKRSNVSELFLNECGDRYYACKVCFITLDEKSGAEKKTASQMLAQASTIEEAREVLVNGMKGTLSDYTVEAIQETKIIDIYMFND